MEGTNQDTDRSLLPGFEEIPWDSPLHGMLEVARPRQLLDQTNEVMLLLAEQAGRRQVDYSRFLNVMQRLGYTPPAIKEAFDMLGYKLSYKGQYIHVIFPEQRT